MSNHIGKTCPFCQSVIKPGIEVLVCAECGIPHHSECWHENNGCTTFGCASQHFERLSSIPAAFGRSLMPTGSLVISGGTDHRYDSRGVCTRCGCSRKAIRHFGWICRPISQPSHIHVDRPRRTTRPVQGHSFKNGVCVRCGCSSRAVNAFGWSCRP